MPFLRKISCKGMLLIGVICLSMSALAKEKEVTPIIKSWRMLGDYGQVDTTRMDTAWLNLSQNNMVSRYSAINSYNGNIISPLEPKYYFLREGNGLLSGSPRKKEESLFAGAYLPYLITPQDVRYYNTTIAYSNISLRRGFTNKHQDNDLHFAFTGNLKPNLNVGMELNYLNSPGHYADQEGKLFNGDIFGSYDGKHYGLKASVMYSGLSNFENGGLVDASDLNGPLAAQDMPVRLHGMSGLKYVAGYLNHHYSIGTEREDTALEKTVFVPILTFAHTFTTSNVTKRYVERNSQSAFYPEQFYGPTTSDSTNTLVVRNTLSVTFEEAFNRLLRFGATVYATNECVRYQMSTDGIRPAPDSIIDSRWTNNTRVGGALYKNEGKYIRYGVEGNVCLVGYKMGEFEMNGHINSDFRLGKDTLLLQAEAYVKNEQPDYYLQHYRSNHYRWDNDFGKTYRIYAGGEVSYPTKWIKPAVRVGFENLTHPIYFASNGKPMQHEGNIQILAVDAKLDLTTPWVNLENRATYQTSSDSAIALPTLALQHRLYYHGCWFKALYTQWGVSMRYHTRYYAPILDPATGQFLSQHQTKVGGYPMLDAYINFYVKSIKLKFFIEMTHFNYYFMKNKTYLSMPGYAENPAVIRAGAAWHFWR